MCLPPTVLVPTSCALKAQRCHRFCAKTLTRNSEIHFCSYNRCDLVIGWSPTYLSVPLVVAAKLYFWVSSKGFCAKTVTALAFKAQDVGTKTVGGRHTTFTYTLFSVWSVVLYTIHRSLNKWSVVYTAAVHVIKLSLGTFVQLCVM